MTVNIEAFFLGENLLKFRQIIVKPMHPSLRSESDIYYTSMRKHFENEVRNIIIIRTI